jgi:hypothetical protein
MDKIKKILLYLVVAEEVEVVEEVHPMVRVYDNLFHL